MPFSKIVFSKALKGIRKRATGFFLLAILFLVVGFLQDVFVNYQTHKTTTLELNESADEIASEIYKNDKWDMKSYRQAFFSASSWYVFTADGTLIDNEVPIHGFSNLFRAVEFPTNLTFETPQTITSEVGGEYRLLARQVLGGIVIVGVDIEESTNNQCAECVDEKIAHNLAKFGSTLTNAAAVSTREISEDISYAVIGSSGELKSGLGEVPLKVDPTVLFAAAGSGRPLQVDSQIYILVSKPILDSKNKIVGTVIIPGDITLQQRAVNEQWKFSLALSALAFAITVFIAVYFIGRELARSPNFESLPEALQTPENLNKEFKSSFQWDIGRNCKNLDERIKALKTIVAFLNSEGGVLFIGVSDDQTVRGLREDLEMFKGSTDKFLLQIRDLISDKIGAEFAPLIKTQCEDIESKTVCVIKVERATEPAFLKGEHQNHFYTREGPRTNELDPKEANAFIRSKRWNA
jgi:hypothetical protein